MITVRAYPGPGLEAQLVGLGCPPAMLAGFVSLPRAAMPPGVQANVDAITPSLTTGSSAGPVKTGPDVVAPEVAKKTNWLLYGGIGLGVLVLGALLLRD